MIVGKSTTDGTTASINAYTDPGIADYDVAWGIAPRGFDDSYSQLKEDDLQHIYPEFKFTIVTYPDYNIAYAELETFLAGGTVFQFTVTKAFLSAFIHDTTPAGATASPSSIIVNEPGMSHNVGAIYQAVSNPGPVIKASYAATSDVSDKCRSSATFSAAIKSVIGSPQHKAQVYGFFSQNPTVQQTTFTWDLPNGLNFGSPDLDLETALRKCDLSGTVTITVGRQGNNFPVSKVEVAGAIDDINDYNYSGSANFFVRPAAKVQAGYNTLGTGGHVFRPHIDITGIVGAFTFSY